MTSFEQLHEMTITDGPPLLPPKLTLELANPYGKLTDDQARARIAGALHEAAHIAASAACPGSMIISVHVDQSQRSAGIGYMNSIESYTDEDQFVTLAGWAWEYLFGGRVKHAQRDLEIAMAFHTPFDYCREETLRFIAHLDTCDVIDEVAYKLLQRRAYGPWSGGGLSKYFASLRPYLTPFKSLQRAADVAATRARNASNRNQPQSETRV